MDKGSTYLMKNRPDKPGWWWWEPAGSSRWPQIANISEYGREHIGKLYDSVTNLNLKELEDNVLFGHWLGQAHPPKKVKIYSVNMMTKDAASTYGTRAITRKMAAYEDIKEFLLEDDMTTDRLGVLAEILEERHRQDKKWGEQNLSPIEWQGILMEEVGEQAREANDNHFEVKDSLVRYRSELIQVAAVAVSMIECLDRGKWEVQ